MKKKRHTVEQIIRILREADSGLRNDEVCLMHNISQQTFYRWKRKYESMDLEEAQRLGDLEKENSELKTLLAEQLLKTKALEIALGKPLLSPDRQRSMAAKVQRALSCSRRAVCRWLGLGLCLGLHPTRRKVTHLQLDR